VREHEHGVGGVEHARGTAVILTETTQPDRRVQGHRHRPGKDDAEEGIEELPRCREDEGHPLTTGHAQLLQAPAYGQGALLDLRPRSRLGVLGAIEDAEPGLGVVGCPLQQGVDGVAVEIREQAAS